MGNASRGFSLIELLVVIAILGVVIGVAVPGYLNHLPRLHLQSACRELVSTLHYARVQAIRDQAAWRVQFNPEAGTYCLLDGTGATCRDMALAAHPGVAFGANTPAVIDANHTPPQADGVSFSGEVAVFNPNGTAASGTIYLKNQRGDTLAAGTASAAGRIKTWRHYGKGWE